jgi:uncharacterized membrane protein YraQ (UPF0718 family)
MTMAELGHTHSHEHGHGRWKLDRAVMLSLAILAAVLVLTPGQFVATILFALEALGSTAPFIVFAVIAVGWLKAAEAEALLARAFEGRETRMIVAAALVGGLAPFCSCEVIPFIAAALAVGAPLSAVMAFWLASPLMDPAMFLVTAGTLGPGFAVAKTVAAVGIGLGGGFVTRALSASMVFADPLRASPPKASCCGSAPKAEPARPHWRFWTDPDRRQVFGATVLENALFLGKWLFLAYLIEALMLRHVPAEWIGTALGGEGLLPILTGALIGGPAYLNGFAAVPLVDALLQQGMAPGAAMSFMIAGGVSCIPAAVAVWALVKPRVFAAYVGFGFAGSILAGLAWGALA